jgi:hypothetical protein
MGQLNPDAARQEMEVSDDAEWEVISNKIVAVQLARNAMQGNTMGNRGGRGGAGGMGGGRGNRGGAVDPTADPTLAVPADPNTPSGNPLNDVMTALQAAYAAKASPTDLKAATTKVRVENNNLQAAYIKAENDLRSLLTSRQEAYLTIQRLLQ